MIEIFGRLKAAFREYRHMRQLHQPTRSVEPTIVFYAAWLGHYVADGSQPLHTTIHYNGWVGPNPNDYTTQHLIHAQFESAYVAQNITARDFAIFVHPPNRIADPFGTQMLLNLRYTAWLDSASSTDAVRGSVSSPKSK